MDRLNKSVSYVIHWILFGKHTSTA